MSSSDGEPVRAGIPLLRFKQWLDIWNSYDFNENLQRRKPSEHIYMFSMKAAQLRVLCDVYRRKRDGSNVEGIQRVRDEGRTARIRRYVRYGYPYGDLRQAQRTSDRAALRKPGWLPTAIVVNILVKGDVRRGKTVRQDHLITVDESDGAYQLLVPPLATLETSELAPLEVIDGQHRLWAFDENDGDEHIPDDFELPVVAFYGLDVAWQAYLFWSINVSPKKINPSHAFDLYPLLRTQDWLETAGELPVYREARAQELTDTLYSSANSVWHGRINMLGERGTGIGVSQAAWVRSLLSTFLATGRGVSRPGLFQANLQRDDTPLEWERSQQAAFLMTLWADIRSAIEDQPNIYWIRRYRSPLEAFTSKTSMLNQDMGVRAVLAAANDLFFENAELWELDRWYPFPSQQREDGDADLELALESIAQQSFRDRMRDFARALVKFDWRSLDGPDVAEGSDEATLKRSYRGSGGYASLRHDIIDVVAADRETVVGVAARELVARESLAE